MPSPTPSMPRQPVGNQPSNELPATEPARGSNNNFRQLPLNQPPTQPAYQPAQQCPGPHKEPMGTPQTTDWYNHGTRDNARYPGNHQDERPNDFRTRNGDRGNGRNDNADFRNYDQIENFGNPRRRNRSDDYEPGYGNSLATLEKIYKEDYKYSG